MNYTRYEPLMSDAKPLDKAKANAFIDRLFTTPVSPLLVTSNETPDPIIEVVITRGFQAGLARIREMES